MITNSVFLKMLIFGLCQPVFSSGPQREVCWDIDRRGYSGETLLHVCFMSPHNKDVNFEIAKQLIKTWPKMIDDFILGTENYGNHILIKQSLTIHGAISFVLKENVRKNSYFYSLFTFQVKHVYIKLS